MPHFGTIPIGGHDLMTLPSYLCQVSLISNAIMQYIVLSLLEGVIFTFFIRGYHNEEVTLVSAAISSLKKHNFMKLLTAGLTFDLLRFPFYVLPLPFSILPFTFYLLGFTFCLLPFTFYLLPFLMSMVHG